MTAPMQLELRGLTKRFGSFVANDQIDLTVEPGEIHCLLGENGAGKTTLMNMLYGLLTPDDGEIRLDGSAVRFASPGDAIDAGLGMVRISTSWRTRAGLHGCREPSCSVARRPAA